MSTQPDEMLMRLIEAKFETTNSKLDSLAAQLTALHARDDSLDNRVGLLENWRSATEGRGKGWFEMASIIKAVVIAAIAIAGTLGVQFSLSGHPKVEAHGG